MKTERSKIEENRALLLKKLQEENRQLKKMLTKKDKELAEASALLTLKKKADLLWGKDEDA